MHEYIYIGVHVLVCFFLASSLLLLNFILSPKTKITETISAYECGFETFNNARLQFNIQFYLIALLFILFDVELMYLFPLVKCFIYLPLFSLCIIYLFLIILGIGFVYEWRKGALDW